MQELHGVGGITCLVSSVPGAEAGRSWRTPQHHAGARVEMAYNGAENQ
jgi:hypothetical protein